MKKRYKFSSISTKLIIIFITVLLIFSIMISILFSNFYAEHVFQTDLLETNISLCKTISDYIQQEDIEFSSLNIFHNRKDFNFIGNIAAMEDVEVWLITADRKVISHNEHRGIIEVDEIPTRYHTMVEELFEGKYIENRPYKKIWNKNMIGVGAPILKDGRIVGAALMQMHKNEVLDAVSSTIKALIMCLTAAIPMVIFIAVILAKAMMNPLKKLTDTAMELNQGNYEISTNVKSSDEIGLLANVMDQLAVRLKEAKSHRELEDEMRNNFLSGISHELRTPISVIKVQLEALNDGVIHEEAEKLEYYRSMQDEINGLQRLVNDLLDLSRLNSREFQMSKEQVNLWDVLSNSIRGIRVAAMQKNIEVKAEAFGKNAKMISVLADYDRLHQMLLIFLDNAIKYSYNNSVIEVFLREDKECSITITDHGQGISAEELPYIFERFYRGKRVGKVSGSGLGLAIAKQIATQLDIKLSIDSTTDGTQVKLIFRS